MNKIIKRLIPLVMVLTVLLPVLVFRVEAQTLSLTFEVADKSGYGVVNELVRQGIPLEKGQAFSVDSLCLKDEEDKPIKAQMDVTERYNDGSIKWLLCAFSITLRPNEIKKLTLTDGDNSFESNLKYTQAQNTAVLSNGTLSVSLGDTGITDILYNEVPVLKDGGITLFAVVSDGTEHEVTLSGATVTELKTGKLYNKISIKGSLSDRLQGEMIVTLADGADYLDIDFRFTAKGDVDLKSVGQRLSAAESFSDVSYPATEYISESPMCVGVPYINLANPINSMDILLQSEETERFRGAVSPEGNTGFILTPKGIDFAPLQYGTNFSWYDGMSRTMHLRMQFADEKREESESRSLFEAYKNRPTVTVSCAHFMQCGLIDSTEQYSPIKRLQEAVEFAYDKRTGYFEAGSVPYIIMPEYNRVDGYDVRPGETEYNLGKLYMLTGSDKIFTMIRQSAESWADVVVYKGRLPDVYGANRYRTGAQHGDWRFFTSHPYYGDPSGIYMSYVLTGDEYLGETFQSMMDHILRNMYSQTNMDLNMPRMISWQTGACVPTNYIESRYLIQARALYFAYNLYQDEKYLTAARDIAKWGVKAQTQDGFWYQAYYDNGEPFVQGGQDQAAAKNYIMLYGARGLSCLYRETGDENALLAITRFSDYLANEVETYGPHIIDPTGDKNIYEMNEDFSRGNCPMGDAMATDILATAYSATENERYLSALLNVVRSWISEQTQGGSAYQKVCYEDYLGGKIAWQIGGQNTTWFYSYAWVAKILQENQAKVIALGGEDLLYLFDTETKDLTQKVVANYSFPEVTYSLYDNEGQRLFYACNHSGVESGQFTKDLTIIPDENGGIWQGMENVIMNRNVTMLRAHLEQFDMCNAILRPIRIVSETENVTVEILTYNVERIQLKITGKGAPKFEIKDGLFRIQDGMTYQKEEITEGNSRIVEITQKTDGDGIVPQDGALYFTSQLQPYETPFKDIEEHWAESSIVSVSEKGIMEGTTETTFSPDKSITNAEFVAALMKAAGKEPSQYQNIYEDVAASDPNSGYIQTAYDLGILKPARNFNPDSTVRRDKMAAMLNQTVAVCGGKEVFADRGIYRIEATVLRQPESDLQAVEEAVSKLELPETSEVKNDIDLPLKGLFDTDIAWSSSNEQIISAAGKVTRPKPAEGKSFPVTLTATVSKNGVQQQKKFEVTVLGKSCITWNCSNATDISDTVHYINLNGQNALEFDLMPIFAKMDAVVGISDSNYKPYQYSDFPVILRLNTEGCFDAIDKDRYSALEKVAYQPGKVYTIHMSFDMAKKVYSAWITPEGGQKILLAEEFRFRESAPEIKNIDAMYLASVTSNDTVYQIVRNNAAVSGDDILEEPKENQLQDVIGLYTGQFVEKGLSLYNQYFDQTPIQWFSSRPDIVSADGVLLNQPAEDTKMVLYAIETERLISYSDDICSGCGLQGEIQAASLLGLMTGADNNRFLPEAKVSRGMCAAALNRIIQLLGGE